MRKRKIRCKKEENIIHGKKISDDATKVKQRSTDGDSPVFAFSDCDDNKYQLETLRKDDLKKLIKFFKKVEKVTWGELMKIDGFNFENRDPSSIRAKLPDHLSEDLTMISLRVSQKFRIWGFRNGRVYHIVWFDKEHKIDK